MDEAAKYDDIFAEMAGRLGGLPPMMDAFFGFLARRTDFYVLADPGAPAPMGFPAGVAKRILMQSFDKYTFRDYTDTDHYKYSNVTEAVPDASPICAGTTSNAALTESAPAVTRQVASSAKVSNASTEPDRKARPIGNGGLGPGYYWTQTLKEVTIHIDIDNDLRKSDIACTIEAKRISVAVKGVDVLSGEFENAIRRSESMWTISSGDAAGAQLVVSLEKTLKTWWKSAVTGHPEIDTTKVDSTQSIDEYDEETQATIRKLMFEQKEKRRLEGGRARPPEAELTRDNVVAQFAPPSAGPFI